MSRPRFFWEELSGPLKSRHIPSPSATKNATYTITIPGIFYNLSAVTLGNLVGGFMVALVYWWAFAEKKA